MQQDEGDEKTAEEQHALSDTINTVTQVTWTTWDALYKLYIQYSVSELLDSVQQGEGEQRTAEEQHALSDTINTVTQIPRTARHAINKCTNYWDKTTNRCRDTAFYSYWLALEFPWWKDRGLSQSGQGIGIHDLYQMLKHTRDKNKHFHLLPLPDTYLLPQSSVLHSPNSSLCLSSSVHHNSNIYFHWGQ